MNRRDFIRWLGVGAVSAVLPVMRGSRFARGADAPPDVVVVRGGTVEKRLAAALAALGGAGRFFPPGKRCLIKPNIAWARTPEQAATTDPETVACLVRLAKEARAARVVVMDNTCNNFRLAYDQSGVEKSAAAAGATVLPANEARFYRKVAIPRGKAVTEAMVLSEVLDCEVLINVPVVKVHSAAKVTLGMKNWLGVVYDRQALHKAGLHQGIADLASVISPQLVVLDATRILKTRGPAGPGEVETLNCLVAGVNQVAVDAFGATLLGFQPADIPHIKLAHEMGLGPMDLGAIKVREIAL